jgi:DNA-binding transcriptional ArsR family regulator
MTNNSAQLDRVYRAVADPTRRAVIERLCGGAARSVSELAKPFRMALPTFLQHLKVMEECGLLRSRKTGRVRTFEFEPKVLKKAESWMATQRAIWEKRLDQFDSYVKTLRNKGENQ